MSDDQTGDPVTHAGIAVVSTDGRCVLLCQRADDPTDAVGVRESWEFPGGGLNPGEDPWAGAAREFVEETGWPLPPGAVTATWQSGPYQGFVYTIQPQLDMRTWTPTAEVQAVGWFDSDEVQNLEDSGLMRPEIVATMNWYLVFPETEQEDDMTSSATETDEPDYSGFSVVPPPLMMHGVLAPEAAPSGDGRGFTDGAVTARPLRLPFGWQEWTSDGHNQSITVGSIDRMMRKDGLIHWEGPVMSSPKADEFVDLLSFMGQYGTSIDGVNGNIDMAKSKADGMAWFDAVKVAGAVACSIPAFAEAYVALGPSPDMPPAGSDDEEALTASGMMAGQAFARGSGYVTNPVATNRIHDYWTVKGQPGYDKVGWGTPGDFARAKALIGEVISKHSPKALPYLNAIIAQWHHDALGYWPATHAKMVREATGTEKTSASADGWEPVLSAAGLDADERKRLAKTGAALPDGSFPIRNCTDLLNAVRAVGRAKNRGEAIAHIKKRKADLSCPEVLPASWSIKATEFTIEPMSEDLIGEAFCIHDGCGEPGEFEVSSDDDMWFGIFCAEHAAEHEDQPLFASAATKHKRTRPLPPSSYFTEHPDSDATVVEEPDEFGIRRTYGMAAEWGVCHIGKDGRCVEPPEDPTGSYADFHLGRTKTKDSGYIKTGLITYGIAHRGAEEILSETPTQAHFDDLSHAWAAVVIGENERGIWFSGVVLPTVEEKWITAIEASGQVSGEWLRHRLRSLLTVNIPGFPVLRSSAAYDEDGEVLALVASAFGAVDNGTEGSPCNPLPTPAERLAALREIDREVKAEQRFAALKAEYLAERSK